MFNNSTAPPAQTIGSLKVNSVFTIAGQRQYNFQSAGDPIVSYNGAVLAKGLEYTAYNNPTGSTTGTTAFTPFIELSFDLFF